MRTGEDRETGASATCDIVSLVSEDSKIPKGRLRRSAKLGSVVGMQGARYAGTKATNVGRSEEDSKERLEQRHLETAMKMVGALGQMKGAAMKLGQFASFIDTEFIPDEYREIYQEQLAKLRTDAPAMPWEKVEKVLDEEYEGEPLSEIFAEFEPEAFAAASIGQVHRAELLDGRAVAVKIQYPGIAEALDADLRNAGTIVRLARALAPGLDAKEIAKELRERVMEELDYEYEAQNQRSFARAYREHPFIYVPEVITRLSRRRVLVTELVEGVGFEQVKEMPDEERSRFGEIVFRGSFGSIYHLQHFNADPHPGNYILMADGRVAFLDFGMTKKLDHEQIVLEQRALDAAFHNDPEGLRQAFHELGFVKNPSKLDAERLMEHTMAVGGWYIEDREIEITARRVMKIIESTNDPRSEYYDLMRRESLPAEELMGRRMEIGVVAVLGQLRAKRNWHRIMREWIYADPPATELGEQEWEYFEGRGVMQTPDCRAVPRRRATMSRIKRGWELTKKSWGLLRENPDPAALPALRRRGDDRLRDRRRRPGHLSDRGRPGGLRWRMAVIGFYLLAVIGTYFSVGLAAAADMIFRGQQASVGDGLAVARSRLPQIAGWAAVSTTIGLALSALENQGVVRPGRRPSAGRRLVPDHLPRRAGDRARGRRALRHAEALGGPLQIALGPAGDRQHRDRRRRLPLRRPSLGADDLRRLPGLGLGQLRRRPAARRSASSAWRSRC